VRATYDAIIIGAGAAGLYAALNAGRRGRRVLVLDHNAEPGAKILISGGGRCNFTNVHAGDHARYLSENPHFARSALTRHPPSEFIALAEKHGIAYYEKTLGQLFCEGARSAHKIVRMLIDECAAAGVTIKLGCMINAVRRNECFAVDTNLGAFESETLTIASGGLAIPKLGASGIAFALADQFAIPVAPPRPGLVPLTFAEPDLLWMRPLSGASTRVLARCGNAAFLEGALFTHRGLSGPAVLQVSSYWRAGERINIDWAPEAPLDKFLTRKRERPRSSLKTALAELLPDRLAQALAARASEIAQSSDTALGDIKDATLLDIARALKTWPLTPVGTEGYAKAEVMVGGIDTAALSQQTLECRLVKGLFFIGECVDVTGWLGGYNFQWAWSSAAAAAVAI